MLKVKSMLYVVSKQAYIYIPIYTDICKISQLSYVLYYF